MIKRSKASVVFAVLASIITFATYYLLITVCAMPEVKDILTDLKAQSPAIGGLANDFVNLICTSFLVLAIATLVLGILARYFVVANVLLNIIAWFYLFHGIIVLCFFQFVFCLIAVSRNKKYFKKRKQQRDAEKADDAVVQAEVDSAAEESYAAESAIEPEQVYEIEAEDDDDEDEEELVYEEEAQPTYEADEE